MFRQAYTISFKFLHYFFYSLQVTLAKKLPFPSFMRYIWPRKYSAPFHFPYYTAYVEVRSRSKSSSRYGQGLGQGMMIVRSTLCLSNKSIETFNDRFSRIMCWLIANGLKWNTNKSNYMIFGKPNKNIPVLQLRINNANIDEVQNFNFLGLQLSSTIHVTWNLHIDEIFTKISRRIGILKKLQLIVPTNVLLTIYNTLILSHINYCLLVWGSKSGKILQLQKKQFDRSPVQDTFLIQNHYLNSMIF